MANLLSKLCNSSMVGTSMQDSQLGRNQGLGQQGLNRMECVTNAAGFPTNDDDVNCILTSGIATADTMIRKLGSPWGQSQSF